MKIDKQHTFGNDGFCIYCHNVHRTDCNAKREMALRLARVCGYENDTATFTRLLIESRVNRQAMNEAFQKGAQAK